MDEGVRSCGSLRGGLFRTSEDYFHARRVAIGDGPLSRRIGFCPLNLPEAFNTAINQTRAVVERVIANLKTWRILHTDYRRPLGTFNTTISAVIGLQFYSLA